MRLAKYVFLTLHVLSTLLIQANLNTKGVSKFADVHILPIIINE